MSMNTAQADAQSLTMQVERQGETVIVRCGGRLVSSNSTILQATVKPLIAGAKTIVLDLTDLVFMDSMGLGAVASLYISSKTAGCQFELINLSRRIRDLFSMTHLLSLFAPCGETNVPIS